MKVIYGRLLRSFDFLIFLVVFFFGVILHSNILCTKYCAVKRSFESKSEAKLEDVCSRSEC